MRTQGLKFKIVLVISFTLISCGKSDHQGVRQITVHELKARLDVTGPIGLYDVRTLEEIAIASIKGATVFNEKARETLEKLSKDTPIILFCHRGGRSQKTAKMLSSRGYTNVSNVVGGIDAWAREIDSTVSRY
tara:strand:+ start:244 stop:642 length:399 start_codon:yes stop_codon:yes gene_type:complete